MAVTRTVCGAFAVISGDVTGVLSSIYHQRIKSDHRIIGMGVLQSGEIELIYKV